MTMLNRRDLLGLAAVGAAGLTGQRLLGKGPSSAESSSVPPNPPRSVPLCGHLGKSDGDFTSAELDFLAKHFDLVCIEKGQAVKSRGCTEEGIYEAARQLKRRNPRMRVLFYWNAFINYPLYRAFDKFNPNWQLRGRDGKPVLNAHKHPRPDLSLPEVREWWSDVAAEAVRAAPLDGIFADALPQVLTPALPRVVGEEKAQALIEGLREMLALARRKMGADKLVLANGLRATDYRQILDWDGISGVMIEHFGHFSSKSEQDMKADLESLAIAAAKNKSIVLKGWPGFDWMDKEMMKRPYAELLEKARENVVFPLACFLVGAQPHSSFCYSWGYREFHGTLDAYHEFDRPIGAAKGEAVWEGFTATREYEHASVRVNLTSRQARIEWKA